MPKEWTQTKNVPSFDEKKIANRKFHVRHRETGRTFEIVGSPNIHKWEIWEVTFGPHEVVLKRKHIPELINWQSKRKLMDLLHNYLTDEFGPAPSIDAPKYTEPWAPMPKYNLPVKIKRTKLYYKEVRSTIHRYQTEDRARTFYIEKDFKTATPIANQPAPWRIREVGVKGIIETNLLTREDAQIALYRYLDDTPIEAEHLNETLHVEVYKYDTLNKAHLVRVVYRETGAVMSAFAETPDRLRMSIDLETKIWTERGYTVVEEYIDKFDPKDK